MKIFTRFSNWIDRLCEANEKLKQTPKPEESEVYVLADPGTDPTKTTALLKVKKQKGPLKGPFPYTPVEISEYLTKASKRFSYFSYIDRVAIERCDLNLIQQAASLTEGGFLHNSKISCLDMAEYGIITQCRITTTPSEGHKSFSVGAPGEYWNSAALVFALTTLTKTANIYWDLDEEIRLLGYVCITPEAGETASNCPKTIIRLRKILKSMKADYKKHNFSDTNVYLF